MNKQANGFFTAMKPDERRATAIVASVSVLRLFALFALLPVMSVFAGSLYGATPLLIGMAVGGYGLTQALLQIPFGALSDRLGRVPVILFGLALFVLGSIVAALSQTIYGVIAGRLLQGAGAISATLTALLADSTRVEIRTRTMALLGVGIGASFLLALILGPAIAAASSVRALFWIAAGLAVVAAMLLIAMPEGIVRAERAATVSLKEAFKPRLLRLDLYIFVLHALLTATFVALPFLLRNDVELPVGDHWKVYTAALALSLVGTIPLILADERRGKAATVSVAVLLIVLGQLLLAFGGFSLTPIIAGLALFFAGFSFLEAGLPARLSILAGDESRGASLGVFSSSQFMGIFAGGLLGGKLLAGGRPPDVFMACALIAAVWLMVHRIAN